ncbi:MAG TPA: HAD hydrolase-like protein [Alphaproteobacteria bacterium]|nr:HAD family hydrolase [Alphaproteobacteria bacterium]HOO51955.1 HAD hydrolase-like protein [Alphaproteobacteria bacterium]
MKYKFGIFDWNGTLIDDSHANLAGANATFRLAGVPELSMERYRETMDFPLIHFYNRNGVDTDTYLANVGPFGNAFFKVYREQSENAPLKTGAMKALDHLLEQDVVLMILSNHLQDHLEEQLAERHVHSKFKHISGNEIFDKSQITKMNKLERLQKIMKDNGYKAHESFIIGDSLEEPAIAKAMGMTSVSVTWGCFSRARLEESSTHHVIDEIDELAGFLSQQ